MTTLIVILWLVCSVFVIFEKKIVRMILWLFLSSIIASIIYLLLGSPDLAMAEATASAFVTIIFVIGFEKFFNLRDMKKYLKDEKEIEKENKFKRYILPAIISIGILVLFINFAIPVEQNDYLKNLILDRFTIDIGGENAVTAIYLGYRVYDTIFEALLLVIAVVAVVHMSNFDITKVNDGKHSELETSGMALFLVRIVAPITIIFGVYLIANGFLSAGGGFQGGLAIACFFVCRFFIYDIYDLPIKKINRLEDFIFIIIVAMAALTIFAGLIQQVPYRFMTLAQEIYLFVMNALIGIKVALGFIILFYRYVAIERN
ncbi:MAG: DUF4040 domain-containing protein [Defluviitaleaceae bacterium]|nr:DUF4040 domain-containing protein [Defluviitaleaceae bacterium]